MKVKIAKSADENCSSTKRGASQPGPGMGVGKGVWLCFCTPQAGEEYGHLLGKDPCVSALHTLRVALGTKVDNCGHTQYWLFLLIPLHSTKYKVPNTQSSWNCQHAKRWGWVGWNLVMLHRFPMNSQELIHYLFSNPFIYSFMTYCVRLKL